jgi:methionyl-tRNA synthetase
VEAGFEIVGEAIQAVHLRAGLQEGLRLAREVNAYLDQAPWFGVIKEDRPAAAKTVYTALRAIDSLKILLAPYLPFSAQELHNYLGYSTRLFGEQFIESVPEEGQTHDVLRYDDTSAAGAWEPSQLPPGQLLHDPKPLFVKLDEEIIDQERARLGEPRPE